MNRDTSAMSNLLKHFKNWFKPRKNMFIKNYMFNDRNNHLRGTEGGVGRRRGNGPLIDLFL